MAGEFDLGDYQSFPTNSSDYTDLGDYQSFPAPSPSGGYAPGAGGEGTLSADEFAANAGVGAPGATASGLGMLQKLMAATGLSEKQLMGLGAAGISSLTSLYGASQIGKAASTAANIGAGRLTALRHSSESNTTRPVRISRRIARRGRTRWRN